MHAIRRDPEKRYKHMKDMLHDLDHLDEVTPVPYNPETAKLGRRYRRAILLTLVVIALFLALIAFGVLAQFAHHAVH